MAKANSRVRVSGSATMSVGRSASGGDQQHPDFLQAEVIEVDQQVRVIKVQKSTTQGLSYEYIPMDLVKDRVGRPISDYRALSGAVINIYKFPYHLEYLVAGRSKTTVETQNFIDKSAVIDSFQDPFFTLWFWEVNTTVQVHKTTLKTGAEYQRMDSAQFVNAVVTAKFIEGSDIPLFFMISELRPANPQQAQQVPVQPEPVEFQRPSLQSLPDNPPEQAAQSSEYIALKKSYEESLNYIIKLTELHPNSGDIDHLNSIIRGLEQVPDSSEMIGSLQSCVQFIALMKNIEANKESETAAFRTRISQLKQRPEAFPQQIRPVSSMQPQVLPQQVRSVDMQPEVLPRQVQPISKQPEILPKQVQYMSKQPETLPQQTRPMIKQPEVFTQQVQPMSMQDQRLRSPIVPKSELPSPHYPNVSSTIAPSKPTTPLPITPFQSSKQTKITFIVDSGKQLEADIQFKCMSFAISKILKESSSLIIRVNQIEFDILKGVVEFAEYHINIVKAQANSNFGSDMRVALGPWDYSHFIASYSNRRLGALTRAAYQLLMPSLLELCLEKAVKEIGNPRLAHVAHELRIPTDNFTVEVANRVTCIQI